MSQGILEDILTFQPGRLFLERNHIKLFAVGKSALLALLTQVSRKQLHSFHFSINNIDVELFA